MSEEHILIAFFLHRHGHILLKHWYCINTCKESQYLLRQVSISIDLLASKKDTSGLFCFERGKEKLEVPWLPFGLSPDWFVKWFAHTHCRLSDPILHIHILKEFICDHFQSIIWPCLKYEEQVMNWSVEWIDGFLDSHRELKSKLRNAFKSELSRKQKQASNLFFEGNEFSRKYCTA